MCRYGFTNYKDHYACFSCRKAFKRRLLEDVNEGEQRQKAAKCPQCGELMANMGLDFAAPPKDELKQWAHLQRLYSVGIAFHSCGCSGPGYIPNSKEDLIAYFKETIHQYEKHLKFWRQRKSNDIAGKPSGEGAYWDHIVKIPADARGEEAENENEVAKLYWMDKIREVEEKLALIDRGRL